MIIREFQNSDRAAVVALWNDVFGYTKPHNDPHKAIDRKAAVNDGLFFVAIAESTLVGTVMGGYDGRRGWIYSLAVAPEHRRKSVATALMKRVEETLIALSVSGASNPAAQAALKRLKQLEGCDAHLTHIPSPGDEAGLRKLGVRVTADPKFAGKELFDN